MKLSLRCRICREPHAKLVKCPGCRKKTHVMDFVVFPKGSAPPIRKETCTTCRYFDKEKDTMRALEVDNLRETFPKRPAARTVHHRRPKTIVDKVRGFFKWMTDV